MGRYRSTDGNRDNAEHFLFHRKVNLTVSGNLEVWIVRSLQFSV